MKRYIGAGLVTLLCAGAPALANHGDPGAGLDERQYRLEQRIERGWRSGELTRREYRRLARELHDIERTGHYFRSDGYLSPDEVNELHARLDHLSREIRRERRDVERRYDSYNYDYYSDRRYY